MEDTSLVQVAFTYIYTQTVDGLAQLGRLSAACLIVVGRAQITNAMV